MQKRKGAQLLFGLCLLSTVDGNLSNIACVFFPTHRFCSQSHPSESQTVGTCISHPNPTNSTDSKFNFDFAFAGVPSKDRLKFLNAAARWREVIIGDTQNVTISRAGSSACGSWPAAVDDILICAVYKRIDGEGRILGYAGPQVFRSSNLEAPPPVIGQVSCFSCHSRNVHCRSLIRLPSQMTFDIDDTDIIGFEEIIVSRQRAEHRQPPALNIVRSPD